MWVIFNINYITNLYLQNSYRPFLPIVPHIVGDDDESNEVNEQAEVSNG